MENSGNRKREATMRTREGRREERGMEDGRYVEAIS